MYQIACADASLYQIFLRLLYLFFNSNEKLYVRDGAEFVETLIDYVEQEMEPDDMAQSILSSIQR